MEVHVQLKSYNNKLLQNFCLKFFSSELARFSVFFRLRGPISLPKKKNIYTVIRSPHVYSLSRERFSVHTYRRLVVYRLDHNFVLQNNLDSANEELYAPYNDFFGEQCTIKKGFRVLRKNLLKKLPVGVSAKFIFKKVN